MTTTFVRQLCSVCRNTPKERDYWIGKCSYCGTLIPDDEIKRVLRRNYHIYLYSKSTKQENKCIRSDVTPQSNRNALLILVIIFIIIHIIIFIILNI